MNTTTVIQAGKQNDPSVAISAPGPISEGCATILKELGFTESMGSFVYNSGGRAIWVDNVQTGEDILKSIIASAEAIGKRTKINEIRQVLDMPFGEVAVVKPSHEQ